MLSGTLANLTRAPTLRDHIIENPNFYTTFRVALLDLLAASDTKCLDLDLVVRTCLVLVEEIYVRRACIMAFRFLFAFESWYRSSCIIPCIMAS